MARSNYLTRRNGIYYFRRKIPADLIELYDKREEIFSLRTSVPKEAEKRAREEAVRLDREWEKARGLLSPVAPSVAPETRIAADTLTDEQVEHIGTVMNQVLLSRIEQSVVEGFPETSYEEWEETLDGADSAGRKAFPRGDFKAIEAVLEAWSPFLGVALPQQETPAYRSVLMRLSKHLRKAVNTAKALHAGEVVDVAPPPPIDSISLVSCPDTLETLFPRWEAERKPSGQTVSEFKMIVRRFHEQVGEVPLSDITKAHIVAFKDHLILERKLSHQTVEKHLMAVKSLLQVAVDNDILQTNVARLVKLQKPKRVQKARLPYQVEDLNKLFSSEIYHGERPKAACGEAGVWLPLLALFTGARLEELGQLTCNDVRELGGIHYLNISTEQDGQSIKNENSRRQVPLHPELIRLGFLRYVETQREAGHAQVFHLLTPNKDGKVTTLWSKWYGRYARKDGLNFPEEKVFHSFRHTFKDGTRNSGIPKDVHDCLTGHAGSDVGSTYGAGFSLKFLNDAMGRLEYPGLILPGPLV